MACSKAEVDRFILNLGYPYRQVNGQRILGPVVGIEEPQYGCEIFIRNLPSDLLENELYGMCAKYGQIFSIRILVNFSGETRGFAFVRFCSVKSADAAITGLNGKKTRRGFTPKVVKSLDNHQLYVGNVPMEVTEEDFLHRFNRLVAGIVRINFGPTNFAEPQGSYKYAFVEFQTHREAAIARRYLGTRFEMWDRFLRVDWSKPGSKVYSTATYGYNNLFIRNVARNVNSSDITRIVTNMMSIQYIQRIYVKNGYGFIHTTAFPAAEFLLKNLQGIVVGGLPLYVEWAQPPLEVDTTAHNYKSVPSQLLWERRRVRRTTGRRQLQ